MAITKRSISARRKLLTVITDAQKAEAASIINASSQLTPDQEDMHLALIFRHMEEHGKSFAASCRHYNLPWTTVIDWVNLCPHRQNRLTRAREMYIEKMADEIIEIADEPVPERDSAAVQRNNLRVKARQWILSKVAPARYGDRLLTRVEAHLETAKRDDHRVIERVIVDPVLDGATVRYEDEGENDRKNC